MGDITYEDILLLRANPEMAINFAIQEGLLLNIADVLQQQQNVCILDPQNCQGNYYVKTSVGHTESSFVHCRLCRRKGSLKYPVRNGSLLRRGALLGTRLPVLGRFTASPRQAIQLIYHWAHYCSPGAAARLVTTNANPLLKSTVERFFHHLNILALEELHTAPLMGAHHDHIIQIDEALFKGKNKNNRGRRVGRDLLLDANGRNYGNAVDGPWVLGMCCVDEHGRQDLRMFVVLRRDDLTLRRYVRNHVQPGSEVHTDQWAGYNQLQNWGVPPYFLQTVNHTHNFIDPVTGAHTQRIESSWGPVKTFLMRVKHGAKSHLDHHLAQYWFTKKHSGSVVRAAFQMIRARRPMIM